MKDLVLLVPDKNTQFALRGALQRFEALGTREIAFEFRTHPGRDGGVRRNGSQIVAYEQPRFSHSLLVLDFEGSGSDVTAAELESCLDRELQSVWKDRAKAIVIQPEVDVWMWGSDNLIQEIIEWPLSTGIRDWLQSRSFTFRENGKPTRPKEAMEELLRVPNAARSSALYEEIASRISLKRCTDAAFQKLARQLRAWFPPAG